MLNLPNALTLSRIFVVPLLVVVLLTPFSEDWFGVQRHLLGVALFLGAAFTDYLDGQIARRRKQISRFGILLDPIADKLLIAPRSFARREPARARVGRLHHRRARARGLGPALGRGGRRLVISASKMGKFKMAAQVLAVALLIAWSASASRRWRTSATRSPRYSSGPCPSFAPRSDTSSAKAL